MSTITDADGTWEETVHANGKDRQLITPSAAWISAHQNLTPIPVAKDPNKRIDDMLTSLKAKGTDLGSL